MSLSRLQRYILQQSLIAPRRTISRGVIARYYAAVRTPPSTKDQATAITKSIERLVARGLATSLGRKTAERWYPHEVTLTSAGRKLALASRGKQQRLPLR